jgi:basic amino acid/polyamine antiporter, APA family
MTTLVRTLHLKDLILLVIGAVIGSGIFLVSGAVLRQVDCSIVLALLVWFLGGVLSLLGGLTYGELCSMKPEAGGLYVFIRDCFGSLPAFLYGWANFFVIASGAAATLAVAFSAYLGEIIPLSHFAAKVVSVLMIAMVTLVNVRGTRQSADLQNWTTGIKVGAILVMSAVLLWFGHGFRGSVPDLWPAQMNSTIFSGFGVAMISVLWAYEGWQFATFSAAEAVNPQRDFPRAFLVGLLSLIGLYLLANVAYIDVLGAKGAAATDTIAATSVAVVMGSWTAKLVSLAILISMFSAANSIFLTTPRIFYAMARDRIFFQKMAEVHPGFHTPAFAIIAMGVWASILAVSGTFQQLLTYVVFVGWIFYGLAGASIFLYRQREPDAPRTYHTPGYPWTPLLFIISATALVLNTVVAQPRNAAVGIVIVSSGIPAYFVWRKKLNRAEHTSETLDVIEPGSGE